MGRASSAKKVARAAGTGGGRTAGGNTPWGYVGVIALVVILGVALTVTSRNRYSHQLHATTDANAAVAPTVGGTPWHEGYAIDICGTFQKGVVSSSNAAGFTSNGDGVIRIAPKTKDYAGKNAVLGVFTDAASIVLGPSTVGLPGAKVHTNGQDCGSQPARVYVETFAFAGAPGVESKVDPVDTPLADDSLVTVAFVPPAQRSKIPQPPASVRAALQAAVSPVTTTTTVAGGTATSTTVAGTSTSTTVAGKSTTSTTVARKATTSTTVARKATTSTTVARKATTSTTVAGRAASTSTTAGS